MAVFRYRLQSLLNIKNQLKTQAEMDFSLAQAHLTEEEASVYRRGRNAHSPTMAKHATMGDYRRATGLEALVGYLYLKEDLPRIIDLIHLGMDEGDNKDHEQ